MVRPANNAVATGISAVAARAEANALRIQAGRCPHLLAEAQLYRYGDDSSSGPESPLSEHNHALDALRYLIATLDARRLARPRPPAPPTPTPPPPPRPSERPLWWRIHFDPAFDYLWTHVCRIETGDH